MRSLARVDIFYEDMNLSTDERLHRSTYSCRRRQHRRGERHDHVDLGERVSGPNSDNAATW